MGVGFGLWASSIHQVGTAALGCPAELGYAMAFAVISSNFRKM